MIDVNANANLNDSSTSATSHSTTDSAEQVKQYLLDNPNFFKQHPDVLNKLEVPDARKGSVSLVELQNEQLRNKVEQLTTKLSQLIEIAKENQQIYEVFAQLNVALLQADSIKQVQHTLSNILKEQLGLSAAVILIYSGESSLPEIQQRLFKEKRFKHSDYFFGRLSENEKQLIFADKCAESCALVQLGDKSVLGMLAIGSQDSVHFTPDMDTLLLEQLRSFLNLVLPDLINANT